MSQRAHTPLVPASKRRLPWKVAVVLALLVVAGLLAATRTHRSLFHPLAENLAALGWSRTTCTISHSAIIYPGSSGSWSQHQLVVFYYHQLRGKRYKGRRYSTWDIGKYHRGSLSRLETLKVRYRKKSRHPCWVDPGDPRRMVLSRGPTPGWGVVLVCLSLYVGIAFLLWRMRRRTPGPLPAELPPSMPHGGQVVKPRDGGRLRPLPGRPAWAAGLVLTGGVGIYLVVSALDLTLLPLWRVLEARTWLETGCTIKISRVVRLPGAGGEVRHQWDLRYRHHRGVVDVWDKKGNLLDNRHSEIYSLWDGGRRRTGDRRELQALADSLPPGKTVRCLMNTRQPGRLVLVADLHPRLLLGVPPLALVLLALVLLWRRARDPGGPRSRLDRVLLWGSAAWLLAGVIWSGWPPLDRALRTRGWRQARCEVQRMRAPRATRRVRPAAVRRASATHLGGMVHRLDLQLSHRYQGQTHGSSLLDPRQGGRAYTGSQVQVDALAARLLEAGTTPCLFDPRSPARLSLPAQGASPLWALLPLMLLVGLLGYLLMLHWARSDQAGAPLDHDPGDGAVFLLPRETRAVATIRTTDSLGLTITALLLSINTAHVLWNGGIGFSRPAAALGLLGCLGLGALGLQLLLDNINRLVRWPAIWIAPRSATAGQRVSLCWFADPSWIDRRPVLRLLGREESLHPIWRSWSRTTHQFYEHPIVLPRDPRGGTELTIPEGAAPSFSSRHGRIVWVLSLSVRGNLGLYFEEQYELLITAGR